MVNIYAVTSYFIFERKFFLFMKKDNNITNYIEKKPKRSISNLKNNRKGDTKYMVNIEELKTHLDDYLPDF